MLSFLFFAALNGGSVLALRWTLVESPSTLFWGVRVAVGIALMWNDYSDVPNERAARHYSTRTKLLRSASITRDILFPSVRRYNSTTVVTLRSIQLPIFSSKTLASAK